MIAKDYTGCPQKTPQSASVRTKKHQKRGVFLQSKRGLPQNERGGDLIATIILGPKSWSPRS